MLLNRRGFATAVFCRQCAGTIDCPNCSVSLVVHGEGAARRARCHYCNYSTRVPATCPLCAAPYLEQAGFGTERVEAEVEAAVSRRARRAPRSRRGPPQGRARRAAVAVSRRRDRRARRHADDRQGPRLSRASRWSASSRPTSGSGMADFRASERTFQLLTQVAGRAGRGEQPGEAIVQTLYPDHYSIQLACRQDYPAFYERELQFRRAMRYPPLVSLDQRRRSRRARSPARWTMRRTSRSSCGAGDGERRASACSARRRRRSASCAASTARSSSSRARTASGCAKRCWRRSRRARSSARRTTVDVDPLSVL